MRPPARSGSSERNSGGWTGEVTDRIEITPALTELIACLRAAWNDDSLHVLSNRYALHYTSAGFETESSKLMCKALEPRKIARRFTFLDLRAYFVATYKTGRCASTDLHANPVTTAHAYDRNKIVKRKALWIPFCGIPKQKRHWIKSQCRF
jgi:hypothetical protein